MAPDKTFCLKWNNFQQNIFSTIRNLRLDLDFLDVTIFCKGRQMKAHKVSKYSSITDVDYDINTNCVLSGNPLGLQ